MATKEEIKRRVKEQLRWDERIFSEDVNVEVKDSTVELFGTVPTYLCLRAAEDDALFTPGVNAVQNNIQVKYPEGVTVPSDSEIEERINSIYSWHTNLSSYDLNVQVKNGWVTLGGTVESFYKKMIAEDLAYTVNGVIDVKNEITIVPTRKISDQGIAEAIKDALKIRVEVDLDEVDIKVANGVVSLTGAVSTRTAAKVAYETALYTAGVTGVVDNIMVLQK